MQVKWYETLSRISLSDLLFDSVSFHSIENYNFKKQHIRHCILYAFRKCNTSTEAFKITCAVYMESVQVHTCQIHDRCKLSV